LGIETFWFDDKNFPEDFDWDRTLFITEGFASRNIPIRENSCYLSMYEPDPKRFADHARYIELRLCATDFEDHVSKYSFDPSNCLKTESSVFLQKAKDRNVLVNNDYISYSMASHDIIYLNWATNLLPNEINLKDAYYPRKKFFFFSGTISKKGKNENFSQFKELKKALKAKNIDFIHNNPWESPLPSAEVQNLTKKSIVGIDLRSDQHLRENLVTCRVFKNVSYGQLAATNSSSIFKEMNGLGVYSTEPEELLELALSARFNYELIQEGMRHVKNNHTYLNRLYGITAALQL
jgi:hypothetical protein